LLVAILYQRNHDSGHKLWNIYQLRYIHIYIYIYIYCICRFCWNVATYKWRIHNGKIEIISYVVKFRSQCVYHSLFAQPVFSTHLCATYMLIFHGIHLLYYGKIIRIAITFLENKILTVYFNIMTLYNYHPCWSVTRQFFSQRKVRSPDRGWSNFSRGDKSSGHTPTRVIIGILYRILLHQTPSNRIPAALRKYSI
jgi:hypothetical protein